MFKNLITDLDVYSFRKGWPKWTIVIIPFLYWVTWPIIEYRFNHWVFYKVKIPVIRQLLRIIGFIMHRFISTFTTVEISERAFIGKGLFIAHFGDIVIGHSTRLGNYASVHQGVTFGGAGRGESFGSPTVGHRAYLGAGVKIIGRVVIGDDVAFGCNAVVTKDFPGNVTLGGVPAKIINSEGSQGFIHYRGNATKYKIND
jgi:serine O-acetyltransferase